MNETIELTDGIKVRLSPRLITFTLSIEGHTFTHQINGLIFNVGERMLREIALAWLAGFGARGEVDKTHIDKMLTSLSEE